MERFLALFEYKAMVVAGFVAAMLVLERLFPFAPSLGGVLRVVKNFSLAAANALLSPLVVIPVSLFAAQWALDWRPDWWNGWTGLALDLILLDAWIYWWHRANHLIPFLWRFHEVHHLDETLDASSALRFHFGEVLLSSLVRAGVIFLLAIPLSSVLVFETFIVLATVFHHSNVRLPPRAEKLLAMIIVTPSIHWVHHHALRADTDSNYATFLSVWDRLFGSRSKTVRTEELPIGVEGKRDEGLLALVVKPFHRIGK
jgi:sterol desaturase/sphingolipid hydroxylase (fatty acid hydroxylase superfamily)